MPERMPETEIPVFLCRMSGGMSQPPVLAPSRITMPREAPMPRPEKIVFSMMLSVRATPDRSLSRTARETG